MSYQLRPYQQEAADAAIRYFQNDAVGGGGLIVLATGAGKSWVLAEIAHKLNTPILIFCPSREIVLQNYEKMERIEKGISSMYSASVGVKEISMITFATIGSVMNHAADFDVFRNILVDECFPYSQFISTEWGQKRIGQLYELHRRGEALPKVMSYNEVTQQCEPKPIVSVRCTGERMVYRLLFSGNQKVRTTSNHPFLTPSGWKAAWKLEVGDLVYTTKPSTRIFNCIPNDDQIEFILGSIIGDGSIDKGRKMKNLHRFRFSQGYKQLDYLKWKVAMLGCTDKVHKGKSGFCDNPVYSVNSHVIYFKDTMCNKQYALEHLTPKSLAVIWMDDGHISSLEDSGTICAVAESSALTELFAEQLQKMGINATAACAKSSSFRKAYNYIRLRKDGLKKLCEIVSPYVHKSMEFKLTKKTRQFAGTYKWDCNFSKRGGVVLQDIEYVGYDTVYNMEVADNHSYVITTGRYEKNLKTYKEGIIVHNCHCVNAKGGQYEEFIHRRPDRKVVGCTATPYRLSQGFDGGSILKFLTRTRPRIFDKVLYFCQISDLLSKGYLAELKYYDLTCIDLRNVRSNTTGSDYDDRSLIAEYERSGFYDKLAYTTLRVLHPKSGVPRKGVLVFTRFTREAEELVVKLANAGVTSAIVTAETPKKERERIINDFKSGKIQVVSNCNCLSTGFDYPELDTVILARPTKSLALFYQMAGRCIRPHQGKEAWVIDLGGSYRRFGAVADLKIGVEKAGTERWAVFSRGRQLTNVTMV